jgi:hypothetical protein
MERETKQRLPDDAPSASEVPTGNAAQPARDYRGEANAVDRTLKEELQRIATRYAAHDVVNRGGQ